MSPTSSAGRPAPGLPRRPRARLSRRPLGRDGPSLGPTSTLSLEVGVLPSPHTSPLPGPVPPGASAWIGPPFAEFQLLGTGIGPERTGSSCRVPTPRSTFSSPSTSRCVYGCFRRSSSSSSCSTPTPGSTRDRWTLNIYVLTTLITSQTPGTFITSRRLSPVVSPVSQFTTNDMYMTLGPCHEPTHTQPSDP